MTPFLRSVFGAFVLAALFSGAALAQTSAPPAVATHPQDVASKAPPVPDPHWLSPDEIKTIVDSIPAPPAPGSPADQADLKTEIEVQNTRTPERSAQAKKDASLELALFLEDVNPALNATNSPKLYLFFKQIRHVEREVNQTGKARYQRLRPFVEHGDVIHPLGTIDGYSYPSGHSTVAFCDAVVLGRIFPDKASLLMEDAKRMAQSRVVMGVHYTTDIQEGEKDGREIARVLLTKPDFLARLAEVKAEVEQQQRP